MIADTLHVVAQCGIFLTGCSAIWLAMSRNFETRRFGCLIGLCGQPCWFYETISSAQWGMVLVVCVYTASWIRGVYTYWIRPQLMAHQTNG